MAKFHRKLNHDVPHWVEDGSLFHIRIALDRSVKQLALVEPHRARAILESVRFYEGMQRWHVAIFLVMPDHLHALLAFPKQEAMSGVISDWKRYHSTRNGIRWQDNYFDHRLRDDERGQQLEEKVNYIRNNPVAAGLCATVEDWPWVIREA